jgi:hypothetical protein
LRLLDVKLRLLDFKLRLLDVKLRLLDVKLRLLDVKLRLPDVKLRLPDVKFWLIEGSFGLISASFIFVYKHISIYDRKLLEKGREKGVIYDYLKNCVHFKRLLALGKSVRVYSIADLYNL